MKKNKKMMIIFVILLVFVIIYFGAKIILINSIPKVPDSFKEAILVFKNPKTLEIQKTNEIIEDYFTYEDMKLRNDFEPFAYEGQKSPMYTIKNSDMRVSFNKEPKDYYLTYVKENAEVSNLFYNLTKDLEKNNIKTDYDLYQYLVQNVNNKVSIFSSFHTIKRAHILYSALTLIITNVQKVTLINGDYEGYILETNGDKIAYIDYNNETYTIHIWSNGYSDEDLSNLISTIQFE